MRDKPIYHVRAIFPGGEIAVWTGCADDAREALDNALVQGPDTPPADVSIRTLTARNLTSLEWLSR